MFEFLFASGIDEQVRHGEVMQGDQKAGAFHELGQGGRNFPGMGLVELVGVKIGLRRLDRVDDEEGSGHHVAQFAF